MLEPTQRRAFQRIGLVRFNPFEDTGGNQSFALALLDHHGDGFVVSSLHARAGTRVYGKAIARGTLRGRALRRGGEALRLALAMGAIARTWRRLRPWRAVTPELARLAAIARRHAHPDRPIDHLGRWTRA